jgi:hypothetical protein
MSNKCRAFRPMIIAGRVQRAFHRVLLSVDRHPWGRRKSGDVACRHRSRDLRAGGWSLDVPPQALGAANERPVRLGWAKRAAGRRRLRPSRSAPSARRRARQPSDANVLLMVLVGDDGRHVELHAVQVELAAAAGLPLFFVGRLVEIRVSSDPARGWRREAALSKYATTTQSAPASAVGWRRR